MRYAILVVALAGCANNFNANMNSWLGASESGLVGSFGPPQSVYEAPDGARILTYNRSSNGQIGGYQQLQPVTTTTNGTYGTKSFNAQSTTYQSTTSPVYNITYSCTMNFTLRGGKVEAWSANGNHCR